MAQIYDLQSIRIRLEKSWPWTAYALADLEPGHFEKSSWFCGEDGSGLTLLYRGFSTPILFCIEDSAHLESVLDEIDSLFSINSIPCNIVVRPEYAPLIRSRPRISDERPMIRMTLEVKRYRPEITGQVTRLGPKHLHEIHNLFGADSPEFLSDTMLQEGVYFGIFKGPDLAAIAGTHILSTRYGVAALGNVYTRADRRRCGYCGRVTSAVLGELLRLGISTIILNVREENASAIRVYGRLGFARYCRYLEIMTAGASA